MGLIGKAATAAFVKEYIAHQLFSDLPKAVLKAYRRIDGDELLHKAGLARYRPGVLTASGTGLFLLGCALGGVAALLMAPKPGDQLRTDVKGRAMNFINQQKKQQFGGEPAQA